MVWGHHHFWGIGEKAPHSGPGSRRHSKLYMRAHCLHHLPHLLEGRDLGAGIQQHPDHRQLPVDCSREQRRLASAVLRGPDEVQGGVPCLLSGVGIQVVGHFVVVLEELGELGKVVARPTTRGTARGGVVVENAWR